MSKGLRIVLILLVLGGFAAVIIIGAISLKADQDAAVAAYGAEVVNLCKNTVDDTMDGSLPDGAKLAFINAGLSTIHSEFQDKLSAGKAAKDKTTVTHVACTSTTDVLFDTDSYGSTGKYVCKRYAKNMGIALFDVKSGKQIAYWKVRGATPPGCPEKTDKDLSKYGNPPIAADVFSAIGL